MFHLKMCVSSYTRRRLVKRLKNNSSQMNEIQVVQAHFKIHCQKFTARITFAVHLLTNGIAVDCIEYRYRLAKLKKDMVPQHPY